ncbi:MAG TPA: DMT family transporter [Limnochordales bacterium]
MERVLAPRHVYGLIALGVAAVSCSAVLAKLSTADPIALAFYRLTVTWLLLLPAVLVRQLLAAILVSGYLLIGQRVRRRVPLLVYVFWLYGSAAATLGLAAVMMGVPLGGYGAHDWAIFVALAVGPTLLGHTVFNWVLQYVPASVVAVSILAEPIGASALALLILGEVPDATQIIGGVLILTGILVFLRYRGSGETPVTARVKAGGSATG